MIESSSSAPGHLSQVLLAGWGSDLSYCGSAPGCGCSGHKLFGDVHIKQLAGSFAHGTEDPPSCFEQRLAVCNRHHCINGNMREISLTTVHFLHQPKVCSSWYVSRSNMDFSQSFADIVEKILKEALSIWKRRIGKILDRLTTVHPILLPFLLFCSSRKSLVSGNLCHEVMYRQAVSEDYSRVYCLSSQSRSRGKFDSVPRMLQGCLAPAKKNLWWFADVDPQLWLFKYILMFDIATWLIKTHILLCLVWWEPKGMSKHRLAWAQHAIATCRWSLKSNQDCDLWLQQ